MNLDDFDLPKDLSKEELIPLLRKLIPEKMARELTGIQSIEFDITYDNFKEFFNSGLSEKELIAAGYEPVSSLKLLWIKKK